MIFRLLRVVIFVNLFSKNMVILDENCPKMNIVCIKCASWRSKQEWRSIGADTVFSNVIYKSNIQICSSNQIFKSDLQIWSPIFIFLKTEFLISCTDLPFLRPFSKRWDRPTDRPGHQSRFSHQEVRKRRRCFYYCMYLSVNALKQQYFLVKMPMNVTLKSNCISFQLFIQCFYWF